MKANLQDIKDLIQDKSLTTEQKHHFLSNVAERLIPLQEAMGFTDEEVMYMEKKQYYDDLNEGNTPYKPRYICPDYAKFMKQGSKMLEIKPPTNLDEALDSLLILYSNVSSVTGFPVYIGQLDDLLEPFVEDTEDGYKKIDRFLNHIDKTITDSFCHANIGPRDTIIGRQILRSCKEHPLPTPNLTLKYDVDKTPKEFVSLALQASLVSAKPAFANHQKYFAENKNYAIVSCYNSLPIGGGGSTLPRFKFLAPALEAKNEKDFFDNYLPKGLDIFLSVLHKRHTHIMNLPFFDSDFFVKEGLLSKDKFIGMFGLLGLGSAVNEIMKKQNKDGVMGEDEEANIIGDKIMKMTNDKLLAFNKKNKTNYELHAQVGAALQDIDKGLSLATRVSVGTEPYILDHLKHIGRYQKYCKAGCGEHFAFDPLWESRTDKLADLIESGLREEGVRYIGVYGQMSDYIRVTGYLVKRSEVEKLDNGEAALRDTASFGQGNNKMANVFNRKTRRPLDKISLNFKENVSR